MSNNKLMKDTLLYSVTHFGSSSLSFLMLPIYTFYFSPAEFGAWDLALTTVALMAPFITLELVSASYRWLLDTTMKHEQSEIISTGLQAIVRNLLLIDTIAITIGLIWPNGIPLFWETLVLINVSIISSFIQQCARGLQLNKLFAMSGLIQSVIIVVMNLLFMFIFHLRVEALFYSAIIAHLFIILIMWQQMNFQHYLFKITYSKRLMKQFLTYSLPIVPGAISWWIMTMSDRYMIIYFLGVEYNGIYAIANKIPAILLMLNNIFFLAWKDSAITQFDSIEKNIYYSHVFKHFFRLMASFVILLTLFTKPILTFVISVNYFSAWQYIGLLVIGSLFHTLSLFWSAGYHGAKKTKVIFVTSIIGACVNIIINFLFIPLIGLYAVGLSTLVAFFITWIIRIIYAKPYFNIHINYFELVLLFSAIIVANIIPFILSLNTLIFTSCFVILLLIVLNFNFISTTYRAIKQLIFPETST